MIEASPPGASVDGCWLARKQLPPAGVISKGLAVLGLAACVALVASAASRPQSRTRHGRAQAGTVRRRRHGSA